VTLTFDLLTLKVVSESRVTWATSVSIVVIQGLSVLDLYATDVGQHHRLIPRLLGAGHKKRSFIRLLNIEYPKMSKLNRQLMGQFAVRGQQLPVYQI